MKGEGGMGMECDGTLIRRWLAQILRIYTDAARAAEEEHRFEISMEYVLVIGDWRVKGVWEWSVMEH